MVGRMEHYLVGPMVEQMVDNLGVRMADNLVVLMVELMVASTVVRSVLLMVAHLAVQKGNWSVESMVELMVD